MTNRLAELILNEESRRGRINVRDRLAREYIQNHPDIKQDPDSSIDYNDIPEGTTESAIRGIARFYNKSSLVRQILRERRENDNAEQTESSKATESGRTTE